MTIDQKQQLLIEKLRDLSGMEKYQYIIKAGAVSSPPAESIRNEVNRVYGCQSELWISMKLEAGLCCYEADCDSRITCGLAALLIDLCSHQSPEEILSTDFYFAPRTGLTSGLSPTRANGFALMIQRIKNAAKTAVKT